NSSFDLSAGPGDGVCGHGTPDPYQTLGPCSRSLRDRLGASPDTAPRAGFPETVPDERRRHGPPDAGHHTGKVLLARLGPSESPGFGRSAGTRKGPGNSPRAVADCDHSRL